MIGLSSVLPRLVDHIVNKQSDHVQISVLEVTQSIRHLYEYYLSKNLKVSEMKCT